MTQWISVKDRLPENDNWRMYAVLTCEKDLHKNQVAWFEFSSKTFKTEKQPCRTLKVTHWLLLPPWHDVEGVKNE
jgi:hypothetical protein